MLVLTKLITATDQIRRATQLLRSPCSWYCSSTRTYQVSLPNHPFQKSKLTLSRSITRNSRSETSSYIAEDSEEPGPICLKLLTTLKGIQAGKIKDTFGWNSKVEQVDIKKYTKGEQSNGTNGESVDQLP